jgi:hypothetical protein
MWGGIPSVTFAPVVEHSGMNRFLPDTPLNILKANKSASVPWLAGVNAQDGCIIAQCKYTLHDHSFTKNFQHIQERLNKYST